MRRLPAFTGFLFLLLLLCGALPAFATIRTVGPTGDFLTIQAAIDASSYGDSVLVSPGTYYENIDFHGKQITVTSTFSPNAMVRANAVKSTIIDGRSLGPAVVSSSPGANGILSYFTIQNGGLPFAGGSPSSYGGVYLTGSGPNLTGNLITHNNFGGVVSTQGVAQIVSNTITNNTCWGIVSQNLAITNNEISNTQTPALGCTITTPGYGTTGPTLTTNSAGILLLPRGANTVMGNTIENNVQVAAPGAPAEGGAGILVYSGSYSIQKNTIRNNSSPGGRGGGIDVIAGTQVSIYQNLIYGNHAGCGGAALSFDSSGIQGVVISGITIFHFETHGMVVANNTIADNVDEGNAGCPAAAQVEVGTDGVSSPAVLFVNNIISGSSSTALTACQKTASTLATQATFDHNLFYNAGGAVFGTTCFDESTDGVLGNLVADPKFVSPGAGNYQLAAGSPALDAGNNSVFELATIELLTQYIDIESLDIVGNLRVQNATAKVDGNKNELDVIDMGAYEASGMSDPETVAGVYMQPAGYSSTAGYTVVNAFVNNKLGISTYLPLSCCNVILSDAPTGTITFFVDGQQAGLPQAVFRSPWTEVPYAFAGMASGQATQAILLTTGIHAVTATYQATPGVTTAASIAAIVPVDHLVTHLVLGAYPLNATIGTPITFYVIGSSDYGGGYVPTPVTIFDENTGLVIGSIHLDPSTGMGTLVTTVPAGPSVFHANFAGNGFNDPSQSNQIGIFSTSPTSIALKSSQNPASAFVPFTLTAQVTPAPVFPGTEYVHFYAQTGTGSLMQVGIGALSTTGMVTVSVVLPAGTYSVIATYDGDEFYGNSDSAALSEVVNGSATVVSLSTGLNPAVAFQQIPLSAHISTSGPVAAGSVMGSISFLANGSVVGRGVIDLNGNASTSVALPAGTYSLSASFAGNGSFSPSQSTAIPERVTPDTVAVTLSVTPTPGYTPRENELLTATVTAFSSTTVPPGYITFSDNFNGSTTILQAVPIVANGQATLPVTTLAPGIHSLTASYAATANFQASTSIASPLLIIQRDFSLSIGPSVTIETKHHALLPITLGSIGSFTDSINIVCTNLPEGASCNYPQGSSFALEANANLTANIDLDTDVLLNFASNPGQGSSFSGRSFAVLALMLPIGMIALRRRSRGARLVAMLISLVLATSLTACSGKQPAHTPPGTYVISVTGTGASTGQTHTATFNLIVTN